MIIGRNLAHFRWFSATILETQIFLSKFMGMHIRLNFHIYTKAKNWQIILCTTFSLLISGSSFAQYDTLKIVTWNVFLRPAILKDNQLGRVDSIAAFLDTSGADILVLQEVFHKKSRKKLIANLADKYPYFTKVGPKSFWGVPSGVVIFAKEKFSNEVRTSFKSATGSDQLAKKGAVATTFHFKKHKIHVIGTHMQAGGGIKGKKIRKNQLFRIKKLAENLDTNATFVFAGDFNIRKDSEMFKSITDTLDCSTILPEGPIKASASFPDQKLYGTGGTPKWIDFILIRNRNGMVKQDRLWIEEPRAKIGQSRERISDHNPVFTRLILKNKTEKKSSGQE